MSQAYQEPVSNHELIEASINKYRYQYLSVTILISIFEVFMFVRGLIYFNLDKTIRQMYMVCYVALLITSVFCSILLYATRKKENPPVLLKISFFFYVIFLTVWSAVISILDVVGGHLPLVFMTVVMGSAALAYIKPIIYCAVVTPPSIILCYLTLMNSSSYAETQGFVINFAIFIIITFLITYRQYNRNVEDYVLLRKLKKMSYHDQLTGLKNRALLVKDLSERQDKFIFAMFDLDNFKLTNDTYGHDFGDECLKKTAYLLQKYFGDKVYRYGGDEFVVISDVDLADVEEIGNKINQNFKDAYGDKNVHISGGVYYVKKNTNVNSYLKIADEALYEAKNTGKSKIIIH